jgi:hypothetical protein
MVCTGASGTRGRKFSEASPLRPAAGPARMVGMAGPTTLMELEVLRGSEPIEGRLSLSGPARERSASWAFVGWVAFVRAVEEAIDADAA